MKSLNTFLFLSLLSFTAVPTVHAIQGAQMLDGIQITEVEQTNQGRKVDYFDFLVDASGSMMMTSENLDLVKMTAAKEIFAKMNSYVPNLGYISSLHTIAPATTVIPPIKWNEWLMNEGISVIKSDLPIFGRQTALAEDLVQLAPQYKQIPTSKAIIFASDGKNNYGADPMAEIRSLYQEQPNLVFHVISFADEPAGQAVLEEFVSLNPQSILVNADDLLVSDDNIRDFVLDILVKDNQTNIAQVTTGIANVDGEIDKVLLLNNVTTQDVTYNNMNFTVAEQTGEAVVLDGVHFANNSVQLDSSSKNFLNDVASSLKAQNEPNILIQGWTDSTGTDAYDLQLSRRRAEAVKTYLAQQGISANTMSARGMGKSYKYDNSSAEGRSLNRRTEILFTSSK